MTEDTEVVRFIKTPLSDSINWDDMPIETLGRVIVKRRSAAQYSEGGMVIPDGGSRRVMGVAWVVRASGPAANHLHCGDSVICPETSINNGLQFPCEKDEFADYREFDARDVYHVLPYDAALAWWTQASEKAIADVHEALPQIAALADGNDCPLARSWIERLRGIGDLYELYDDKTVDAIDSALVHVVRMEAEHAQRKIREKAEAEQKAADELARERQAQIDKRNAQ